MRASFDIRIAGVPTGAPRDVFGVVEDTYATGVYVEVTDGATVGLVAYGGAARTSRCGPLAKPLQPDTWYRVTLRAEKSDAARVSLELRDGSGEMLDSIACADQPAGAGYFTHLVLGSANPFGTQADVLFDEIEVVAEQATPAGVAPP